MLGDKDTIKFVFCNFMNMPSIIVNIFSVITPNAALDNTQKNCCCNNTDGEELGTGSISPSMTAV